MSKSRPITILWGVLLLGCNSGGKETVILSKGGFEVIQMRANSVQHEAGNLQLWHVPNSGKRSLVWSYVVDAPEVLGSSVVFSGGLTDDRRWKVYPAVLAFAPGGAAVDITEMVTRKHSIAHGADYPSVAGAYRYRIDSASQGVVQLAGMKLPESSSREPQSINVTVSRNEIDEWIRIGRKGGGKKMYGGVEFIVPEISIDKRD
jgi:hypothetical protein